MRIVCLFICIFLMISPSKESQLKADNYGNTLNAGLGIGYYGYIGHSIPVLHLNYEFNAAKNFTLAPFISFFAYSNYNFWGVINNPKKNYYYHQTVVPIGIKGSYYFDQLLNASSNWDFYMAGSVGFAFRSTVWNSNYQGNRTLSNGNSGLFLSIHFGTEYHLNERLGIFLDLSTGISTAGISIHPKNN